MQDLQIAQAPRDAEAKCATDFRRLTKSSYGVMLSATPGEIGPTSAKHSKGRGLHLEWSAARKCHAENAQSKHLMRRHEEVDGGSYGATR